MKCRCQVRDGASEGAFELRRLYDTEFALTTSSALDRETQDLYNVTVVCTDRDLQAPRTSHRSVVPTKTRCYGNGRWLGSRVVSVLDSDAVGPLFKSQSRRCRVRVLGKLFAPVVPLFTKQRNW